MILVLNFGGQYCHLIARRVRDLGAHSEIRSYDVSAAEIKKVNPNGIILSGGPSSVYEKNAPKITKKQPKRVSHKHIRQTNTNQSQKMPKSKNAQNKKEYNWLSK